MADKLPLNPKESVVEIYRANIASPEDLDSTIFWLTQELKRIQSSGFDIESVLRDIIAAINSLEPTEPPENGATGPQGPAGADGSDGEDGADGADGNAGDLIADGEIKYNKTWSSNKINSELGEKAETSDLHDRLVYLHDYVHGPIYDKGTMVTNTDWMSISNKSTSDYAYPLAVGLPESLYPDNPPFLTTSDTSQVRSGYLVTFLEPGTVSSVDVWVPAVTADTRYTLVTVNSPNGTPVSTRRELSGLTAGQWNLVALGAALYPAGGQVLIYLESQNFSSTTQITGDWTYNGRSNNGDPDDEGWNRNNGHTTLRISDTDLASADRTADLMSIVPGSTITFTEGANSETYITTSNPTDEGGHIEYDVQLNASVGDISNNSTTSMVSNIPVPQPTEFVYELGKFLSYPVWADIESFLEYDDVPQATIPGIGYGINFDFQQLSGSDDWDLTPLAEVKDTSPSAAMTAAEVEWVSEGAASTPLTEGQISWIQAETSVVLAEATLTTTTGGFQTIHTATVLPGDAYFGKALIVAERTDGVGFYRSDVAFTVWHDGGAVADRDMIYEAGINLTTNVSTTGNDVEFRVRGRPNQDWDWKVIIFSRDF